MMKNMDRNGSSPTTEDGEKERGLFMGMTVPKNSKWTEFIEAGELQWDSDDETLSDRGFHSQPNPTPKQNSYKRIAKVTKNDGILVKKVHKRTKHEKKTLSTVANQDCKK
jgi:hypothetical protein